MTFNLLKRQHLSIRLHQSTTAKRISGLLFTAIVLATSIPSAVAQTPESNTLARVRSTGKLLLGYQADAQPLSYRAGNGQPAGYAVTLCSKIADDLKTQLQLPALTAEWVEVTADSSAQALQQGKVDLLCNPEAATLARREQVSFSMPIFSGGVAALVRVNAPAEFQRQLENRPPPYKPVWRGTPPAALQHTTASVVTGTPAVELLAKGVQQLKLIITISTEESYATAVNKVAKGQSDVLFGDRAQLQAHLKQSPYAKQLKVLTRHFSYELLAFALPRNDDDFRLAVDRSLGHFLASPKFGELYEGSFGIPDADTVEFFRSLPR